MLFRSDGKKDQRDAAKAEPKAKTEPKATARATFGALHRHGFVRVADAIGIPFETASGGQDLPELREAADLWMHAYVGLYVIHYGPEKLASMMADPIEGKRIKETRALLERTATDVPW